MKLRFSLAVLMLLVCLSALGQQSKTIVAQFQTASSKHITQQQKNILQLQTENESMQKQLERMEKEIELYRGDNHNDYYSIDGEKLNGEPKKKGIYIRNGKKVMK